MRCLKRRCRFFCGSADIPPCSRSASQACQVSRAAKLDRCLRPAGYAKHHPHLPTLSTAPEQLAEPDADSVVGAAGGAGARGAQASGACASSWLLASLPVSPPSAQNAIEYQINLIFNNPEQKETWPVFAAAFAKAMGTTMDTMAQLRYLFGALCVAPGVSWLCVSC